MAEEREGKQREKLGVTTRTQERTIDIHVAGGVCSASRGACTAPGKAQLCRHSSHCQGARHQLGKDGAGGPGPQTWLQQGWW